MLCPVSCQGHVPFCLIASLAARALEESEFFVLHSWLAARAFNRRTILSITSSICQGWISISHTEIDDPIFVPKCGYLFNLGQGLSKEVGLFLLFEPILGGGFLRNVGSVKQESHLCPCFWLFSYCVFTILLK